MFFLRFNHVFAFLMLLSIISAFVIPQRMTDVVAAHLRTFFAPVAWPLHRIASSIHARMVDPYADDTRSETDIRAQNAYLRTELLRVTRQLEELIRINADRDQLGSLRDDSIPMAVVGSDSDRDALFLRPLLRGEISENLPVIYPFGIVGRLDRVGGGSSPRVRLITDSGFRLIGSFRRFVEGPEGRTQLQTLGSSPYLVEGIGDGKMVMRNVTERKAEEMGLRAGDLVVLDDPEWSYHLWGQTIGRITRIGPRPDAPHFVLIELEPLQNLKMRREVMVFDR